MDRQFLNINKMDDGATHRCQVVDVGDDTVVDKKRKHIEKLDAVVLQYQNQKLVQQLEAHRVEYSVLENKFDQQKQKQKNYDDILVVVDTTWRKLVDDLECQSVRTRESSNDEISHANTTQFLDRLLESVASDCCLDEAAGQSKIGRETIPETTRNVLRNIISSISDLWHVTQQLSTSLLDSLPNDETCRELKERTCKSQSEIRSLRSAFTDLHLKHRSLANELQLRRDTTAKNKAEQKRLSGELAGTSMSLKESQSQLAVLRAHRDSGLGAPFLYPILGNNNVVEDRIKDKQKELLDLQSSNQELMELASSHLLNIENLHKQKLGAMKKLSVSQNTLKDVHRVSSSKAFSMVNEQIIHSRGEVKQYQSSVEELQVEKDNYVWKERELTVRLELAELSKKASTIAESRIVDLEKCVQKSVGEKVLLDGKLEAASKEPGRKEIISQFKVLLSSLPKEIDAIQSQLAKYKEDSSEIHSLRAKVKSLTNIMNRKEEEVRTLSSRATGQIKEIENLQEVVHELKESDQELKLFLEMYKRESSDVSDIAESRDLEYKAWAHVQGLESSLDEHNLELRVKAANEAEAVAQQRLAAAETEIAELRQKLEASSRELVKLSEVLQSKREEGHAYLSEIESIGQAYEDVQNKNQILLQEITERDDYNMKLAVEGVKAGQLQDALRLEVQSHEWEIKLATAYLDLCSQKSTLLEDRIKSWSEQVAKLTEDACQNSLSLENTKGRLLDVEREFPQLWKSLDDLQTRVMRTNLEDAELKAGLEEERFKKRRLEEELEILTRKVSRLRSHTDSSVVLGKLKQELREYKGILKCSICLDRQKEVVIAKCYHLFCHPCVRKTLDSRHRKCPTCSLSFGPNDVKPIYI